MTADQKIRFLSSQASVIERELGTYSFSSQTNAHAYTHTHIHKPNSSIERRVKESVGRKETT